MASKFATVEDYLASLPDDRRETIAAVRAVILKNLPKGFEEGIQYNMIGYYVPHSLYPAGYHCNPSEPLPFISLASQKSHMAVYMFCIYSSEEMTNWFVEEYKKTGKRMDMGKSCVRFKKLENIPLELIGEAVGKISLEEFIAAYEKQIPASKRKKK